ncbi:lipid hydrolase [Acanthocystis turfacea Chlorella virus NTS-1]|nr:lipid hydrolase [Acanthocystis turfacea Chlorella virus NTS-1]
MNATVRIHKPEALVLAGGGAKSMSALGAIHVLKKAGQLDRAKIFAGTSAGAIVAAGIALDRDPIEMVRKFTDTRYRANFDIENFGNAFGLDTGENLFEWIDIVLDSEPHTFQSIYEKTGATLIVCATNLSTSKAVYFSRFEHPDMDVKTAIRMSCSLPIYFSAVRHEDEVYVDGALTDPFPVDYVSGLSKNVLGIRYESNEYKTPMNITRLDEFLKSLVIVSTKDVFSKDANVFTIDVGDLSVLDFKNPKKLKKSFKVGFTAMQNFLKKND